MDSRFCIACRIEWRAPGAGEIMKSDDRYKKVYRVCLAFLNGPERFRDCF